MAPDLLARWHLPFADEVVTVGGELPRAVSERLRGAPHAGTGIGLDDPPDRSEPDLLTSAEADGEHWDVQHRSRDRHHAVVAEHDLVAELWRGAGELVLARDRARWHLEASVVTDVGRDVLVVGPPAARLAVARALAGRPTAELAGIGLACATPGSRVVVADGAWPDRAGPSPTPRTHVVPGLIVFTDQDPTGVAAQDVRIIHRAEAVLRLVGHAPDVALLGPGTLDALLALVAGATVVEVHEPDPGLVAEAVDAFSPPARRAPTWCGTAPSRREVSLGWVDGVGIRHDPADGSLALVRSPDDAPEFAATSEPDQSRRGLLDGPRPWLAAGATAGDATTAVRAAALAELDALADDGVDADDRVDDRTGVVLVGDLADALVGRAPLEERAWSVPIDVVRFDGRRPVGPPSTDPTHVEVCDVADLGLPPTLAGSLGDEAVPVPLPSGRWVRRAAPVHRFVLATIRATADDPASLRAVAASAPTTEAGIDAVYAAVDGETRQRAVAAIRLAAEVVGGIPEVWHQRFYAAAPRFEAAAAEPGGVSGRATPH